MAKMGNKLVAMCSVAVGLIYTGAYAVTANQANPSTPASPASTASTASNTSNYSNFSNTSSSTDNNSAANTDSTNNSISDSGSAASNPSTVSYKDGTYTGSGSDRRGTVEVAVTIKQGKIANVEITNYDMRYSESNINPVLLQEVVQRQTYNVDVVSGATSSSEDFQAAVQQALAQAQQSS